MILLNLMALALLIIGSILVLYLIISIAEEEIDL